MANDEMETLSFEAALRELEGSVQKLEAGDLDLEEAIAVYERGMRLARRCSDALERAELRVQQLTLESSLPQGGALFEEESGYSVP